jgi:ABC-type multidrug transport system fused ATPase/permease subunit
VAKRAGEYEIGFVLQDPQLFQAPIWQNIACGQPEATRDAIVSAARLAQAHDFIEALPEGYDTVVGQGGLTLSARSGSGSASPARW